MADAGNAGEAEGVLGLDVIVVEEFSLLCKKRIVLKFRAEVFLVSSMNSIIFT